jgi:hypothetical protein
MKNFVSKVSFPVIALSLVLGLSACGKESSDSNGSQVQNFADESVDPTGAYTAVAQDLFSGQQFIQTGATVSDAIRNALELCNARTSATGNGGCTLVGRPIRNGMGTRVGGEPAASWACLIQENINMDMATERSWIGVGATPQAARAAAEDKCALQAGINCQIKTCFNADTDKNEI